MSEAFSRTEFLLGVEAMEKLASSTVAVFGIGGVGSWAVEALARTGVGGFVLVDDDIVCESNLNRQVHATRGSLGRPKVEVMRERILDINPEARVLALREFYSAQTSERLLPPGISYVVDAIDSLGSKIDLIERVKAAGLPIVSAMGAGNKLDPTRLEVADIKKTSMCPLARAVRKELHKRGIEHLKVVYSRETPIDVDGKESAGPEAPASGVASPEEGRHATRRFSPGSVSFVTAVAGFIIASEVVKGLLGAASAKSGAEIGPERAAANADRDLTRGEHVAYKDRRS